MRQSRFSHPELRPLLTSPAWSRCEALIEAFNLANHTNFGTPIGNLASSSFGKPSTAFDSRQVQLGFRFEF